MNAIGIDYSLNSPGLTIIKDNEAHCHFYFAQPKRKKIVFPDWFHPTEVDDSISDEMVRYIRNAEWVLRTIDHMPRDTPIVIEQYGYGSTNRLAVLAENCGIMKYMLTMAGFKYTVAPPPKIKKFFTGNGTASKGLMIERFGEKTGVDLYQTFQRDKLDNTCAADIADSYAMALFASQSSS